MANYLSDILSTLAARNRDGPMLTFLSAAGEEENVSAVVLPIAGAIACPPLALEKSSLAAPLALGRNVSAPLIELNKLVQGSRSDSFNYQIRSALRAAP